MAKYKEEKKRFTSYLTISSIEELEQLSDLTDIPKSSLMEEAARDLFKKYYGKAREYLK